MGRAWFTEYEHISKEFEGLNIYTPKIINAYFAKKVVTVGEGNAQPTVAFEQINEGILGRDVYVIVETEDFYPEDHPTPSTKGDAVVVTIKTADDGLTGTADEIIFDVNHVEQDNGQTLTINIGDLSALEDSDGNCPYSNTIDFLHTAILKVGIRPNARSTFNTWAENIQNATTTPSIVISVKPKDEDTIVQYGESLVWSSTHPDGFSFIENTYTLENKNVYEIYHGDNSFNTFENHRVNNNDVQKRIGQILNAQTSQIEYFYFDNIDNTISIDELTMNDYGLVLFPSDGDGFGRYGTVDAGGTDNVVRPRRAQEVVGEGDHYLMPLTAAALFGVTQEVNYRNWNVDFGDMSSENGSDPWQESYVTRSNRNRSRGHHAGHGHLGQRSGLDVDLRYLDNNGNSFQGTINDQNFNDANNVTLFQIAFDYGFHLNYATTKAHYAGVNPLVSGHLDHGHWGLGNINPEIII